ncbi:LemA family protein [Patescibacteria group bacterium]|nr:LemA family protein [Patescibacteria group bacterium]
MSTQTIILIILGALALYLIFLYNRLIVLRNRVKEASSDIDVQSKRRYDLIPNLIETVKGYMSHEQSVLENITKARAAVSQGGDVIEKGEAENGLTGTLKTLFAVSENYPDLKANTNFLDLQRELADTENKMQASRRFYNGVVLDLNNKIQNFPTRFIAPTLGFKEGKFFEVASEAERENVEVKF